MILQRNYKKLHKTIKIVKALATVLVAKVIPQSDMHSSGTSCIINWKYAIERTQVTLIDNLELHTRLQNCCKFSL